MSKILNIIESFENGYNNDVINTTTIIVVLLVVLFLSIYEFIVYRYVSHRTFYNKSFNISIAVMPFFISTIIMCLQSNIVITLGTIGALAIIRFRTAVKDPVDMIYILWAIHIGIISGCQLYEVAILTSLVVTIVLFTLEHISFGKSPFILVIHTNKNEEEKIKDILDKYSKKYRIKSRNFLSNGEVDYAIEISIKDIDGFTKSLNKLKVIERFSIIEYDADDIV